MTWPDQPSLPAGLPAGYVTPAGFGDLNPFQSPFTSQQIEALRIKFQESLTQIIVLAVQGFLNAGEAAYDQLASWAAQLASAANAAFDQWEALLTGLGAGDVAAFLDYFSNLASTGLYNAAAGFNNLSTSLLKYLTPTGGNIGFFDASALTGAFNTAVTIGGQAVSALFNGTGQFIGVINSAATGALNTALTVGGVSLNTLFTNINSSGQLVLSGATGALNTAVTIGGQAVSSLFNGSGQFIGVINSAATGALNTAVTVGGTALSTLFTNINSSGLLLGSGITGAINTAATVAGQAIGTIQANAQGLVEGINNAAAGLLSGGSTLLADAQTNFNLLFASAPQFLQGLSGAFGQTATDAAFAAAAQARADQAAEQARITSAFNAVFNVSPTTAGNVSVTVDFSSMSNAANLSGVMSPGNTNIGITSGAATLQAANSSPGDFEVFPTQTTSDYQTATYTFGPPNTVGSTTVGAGNNDTYLICRSNSARNTYVGVQLAKSLTSPPVRVYLIAVVSGTRTVLASTDIAIPSAGNTLRLTVGDPSSSSPYAMQVLLNGTPIITYTDSSHVSQLGASYRYVGFGMRCGSPYSTNRGIDIRAVSYQDNPPPPAAYPFSGRPTADLEAKGRQYASSDCGRIDRDNGGGWENIYLGPKAFATEPPSSGWSWVNQGGASVAADADALLITAPSGSRNWRLRTRSLSPTSNYSAVAYLETAALTFASGSAQWYSGIGLRNSSSSSFITFGPGYYTTNHMRLVIYRWTSATAFSASSFDNAIYDVTGAVMPNWYRIRDDGTNRYFEYSLNGVDWILVFSEGRTAFITPDQFFFGADNEGTGADVKVRLRSLSGIS